MGFLSGIGNVLGSVSGLVGSTLNSLTGVKDTAKQSMNDQIKLWNMQNAYNTPSAQIARMADAGIDINPMTYAVGNGNMSTTAGSIGSPNYSGSGINPIATAMEVAKGIKGMQVQNEEIARMKADTINKGLESQILQMDIDNYSHNHASLSRTFGDLANFFMSFFGSKKPDGKPKNLPEPIKEGDPAIGRNLKPGTGTEFSWGPF